jgi:hypothetical protein
MPSWMVSVIAIAISTALDAAIATINVSCAVPDGEDRERPDSQRA